MRKFFTKHFLKQKEDGRWTIGSGVGLLLIVFVFGVGLYFLWPRAQVAEAPPQGKAELAGVDTAIRGAKAVNEVHGKPLPAEQSSRGVKEDPVVPSPPTPDADSEKPTERPETSHGSGPGTGDSDVFGSIAADATREPPPAPKPRSPVDGGDANPNPAITGSSRFSPRMPASRGRSGSGTAGQDDLGKANGGKDAGSRSRVVIYEGDSAPAPTGKPQKKSGFTTGDFLPRGTEVLLYVLDTVQTDDQETLVTFGVAESVKFQGRYLLPFGTRMLGNAAPAKKGTRIAFNIQTILFPDGKELPISGLVKGMDGHSGIPAYYIANGELPQDLAIAAGAFTKAYLDTLAQYQQQRFQLSLGSNAALSSLNPTTDGTQAAIQAGSNTVQDLITRHINEMAARNAPYLTVIAGTQCKVVLRAATDLTRASENASADDHRDLPPGFEDSVFRPDGTIMRTTAKALDSTALVQTLLGGKIPGVDGGPSGTSTTTPTPADTGHPAGSGQTIPVP